MNSTFVQHSPLQKYLPEGWDEKLDSLIDDAYTYGREGISTAVSIILLTKYSNIRKFEYRKDYVRLLLVLF